MVNGKVGNKDLEEFKIKAIQGRKDRQDDRKVQFSNGSKLSNFTFRETNDNDLQSEINQTEIDSKEFSVA